MKPIPLISVLFLAACARPQLASYGAASDTPQLFAPGVLSDGKEQWRITFSPDGREAYFAESDRFFPISRTATIYRSSWNGSQWSEPDVASFSGRHSDMDPAFSADGRRLFFSSIRPVDGTARTDLDIWMVERRGSGWSEPAHLGPEVNSGEDELYASISSDGVLYFASGPAAPRAGSHWDIFRAVPRGAGFAARERLGSGVNTTPSASDPHVQAAWEFNPEISPDGRTLIFTSLRPGGSGLGDLYVSRLAGNSWTAAQNLGPTVNTTADEYHATLARDGRTLFFVRRGTTPGDFFRVAVGGSVPLTQALAR